MAKYAKLDRLLIASGGHFRVNVFDDGATPGDTVSYSISGINADQLVGATLSGTIAIGPQSEGFKEFLTANTIGLTGVEYVDLEILITFDDSSTNNLVLSVYNSDDYQDITQPIRRGANFEEWRKRTNMSLAISREAVKNTTDFKTQTIIADGGQSTYALTFDAITDNPLFYTVANNGILLNPQTDYVIDPVADTITFSDLPANGDSISIVSRYSKIIGASPIDLTLDVVTTGNIVDNAITTPKIANNAITPEKIPDLGIPTEKIADNAITAAKIPDLGIPTGKFADLSVTTGKIADNAITAAKIPDLGIPTGKFADLSVTTGKIADNAITPEKIPDLSVTTDKIADNAVTSAKIGDSEISRLKLEPNLLRDLKQSKNLLINGAFDVWQRGTSFNTPTGVSRNFTSDRWNVVNGEISSGIPASTGNIDISRITGGYDSSFGSTPYAIRLDFTTPTDGYYAAYTRLERDILARTSNEDVTVSGYYRYTGALSGSSLDCQFVQVWEPNPGVPYVEDLHIKTNVAGSIALEDRLNDIETYGAEYFEFTTTLSDLIGKIQDDGAFLQLGLVFPSEVGTFDLFSVQLEMGSFAGKHEVRHFAEELLLCQRYYYHSAYGEVPGMAGVNNSEVVFQRSTFAAQHWWGMFNYPVTMRKQPDLRMWCPVNEGNNPSGNLYGFTCVYEELFWYNSPTWQDIVVEHGKTSLQLIAFGGTLSGPQTTQSEPIATHITLDAEL